MWDFFGRALSTFVSEMMREPRDNNTSDTHTTIGCELINRKFATDECNIPLRSDGADRISGLIKYHRNKHACRQIFTEFCDVTNPIVSRLEILDLELIPKMAIINCFPQSEFVHLFIIAGSICWCIVRASVVCWSNHSSWICNCSKNPF